MSTHDHTIRVTLVIRVDDEDADKHTPCERMKHLLQYGSFRTACSDAGLSVISMEVCDVSE